MTGKEPALAPDVFHLGAVKQFVMVELAWQTVTGLAGIQ